VSWPMSSGSPADDRNGADRALLTYIRNVDLAPPSTAGLFRHTRGFLVALHDTAERATQNPCSEIAVTGEGDMQLTARTEAEAERIVVDVWLVLERIKLPSPKLTVRSQSPSLRIEFQFEQQIHEDMLCEELLASHGHLCQPAI
jgi:hypothetical protein